MNLWIKILFLTAILCFPAYAENIPPAFSKTRPVYTDHKLLSKVAYDNNIALSHISISDNTFYATLDINPVIPPASQIGHAVRIIHNHIGQDIEIFTLQLSSLGVQTTALSLTRSSFEKALSQNQGSPQEIQRDTETINQIAVASDVPNAIFPQLIQNKQLNLKLRSQYSNSINKSGFLYRNQLLIGAQSSASGKASLKKLKYGFLSSFAISMNLGENLDHLKRSVIRPAKSPIRSDIYDFAEKQLLLDHLTQSASLKLTDNIYGLTSFGYLDEQLFGLSQEFLYRPYNKSYAFGIEGSWTKRRDPTTSGALGLRESQNNFSGLVSAHYTLPNSDTRFSLKAGYFLDRDIGISAIAQKNLKNGMQIGAFATLSPQKTFDSYGAISPLHAGLTLKIPLAHIKKPLPIHTNVDFSYKPFGKDAGQMINLPYDLMTLTDSTHQYRIYKDWDNILK